MPTVSAGEIAIVIALAFSTFQLFPPITCAETGEQDAWQILETAIQGNSTADRVTAIKVLGLLPGDKKAEAIAGKALDDPKPEIRTAAATALGQLGSTSYIPALKKAMSDKDLHVALAAAHALHLVHDDSAYEVYYAVLTGERKGDGLIAEQMDTLRDPKKLAELGFGEGIGFVPFAGIGWDAFRAIKKTDSSPVRAAAASVLGDDRDQKSGEALINAMGDKNWLVRVAALEALAKRNDPALLGRIEASLFDSKKEVRYTAAAVVLRLKAAQDARRSR